MPGGRLLTGIIGWDRGQSILWRHQLAIAFRRLFAPRGSPRWIVRLVEHAALAAATLGRLLLV